MLELAIWKFPLKVVKNQEIRIPGPAEILSIQIQDGVPVLWALVQPGHKGCVYEFITFGTGHPITGDEYCSSMSYLATYQLEDGTVWHVFVK